MKKIKIISVLIAIIISTTLVDASGIAERLINIENALGVKISEELSTKDKIEQLEYELGIYSDESQSIAARVEAIEYELGIDSSNDGSESIVLTKKDDAVEEDDCTEKGFEVENSEWCGTYENKMSGMKLCITKVEEDYFYDLYSPDKSFYHSETYQKLLTGESEVITGEYYNIHKNTDGILQVTSVEAEDLGIFEKISNELEVSINVEPVESIGWGGCYINEESGLELTIVITEKGYSYCISTAYDEIVKNEMDCWLNLEGTEYIDGTYYDIVRKNNGNVEVICMTGEYLGEFRKYNYYCYDNWIDGNYTSYDGRAIIIIYNQVDSLDNIMSGDKVADMHITLPEEHDLEVDLYMQEDGSLGMISETWNEVVGNISIGNGTAEIWGTYYEGICTWSSGGTKGKNIESQPKLPTVLKSGKYVNSDSRIFFTISDPYYVEDGMFVRIYCGVPETPYKYNFTALIWEDDKELITGCGTIRFDENGKLWGDGLAGIIYYIANDKDYDYLTVKDTYYLTEY